MESGEMEAEDLLSQPLKEEEEDAFILVCMNQYRSKSSSECTLAPIVRKRQNDFSERTVSQDSSTQDNQPLRNCFCLQPFGKDL